MLMIFFFMHFILNFLLIKVPFITHHVVRPPSVIPTSEMRPLSYPLSGLWADQTWNRRPSLTPTLFVGHHIICSFIYCVVARNTQSTLLRSLCTAVGKKTAGVWFTTPLSTRVCSLWKSATSPSLQVWPLTQLQETLTAPTTVKAAPMEAALLTSARYLLLPPLRANTWFFSNTGSRFVGWYILPQAMMLQDEQVQPTLGRRSQRRALPGFWFSV